jgi:hypothetical protein
MSFEGSFDFLSDITHMFFVHKSKVCDADLEFLKEHLTLIDTQLDKIDERANEHPDPDSFGVFDTAEGVTGLGFVACQWYLAATYGFLRIDKKPALAAGPRHRSGMTIVEIVNQAANYWKHKDEWPLKKNVRDEVRITEALSAIGVSTERDYVLTSVLAEIAPSKPVRFRTLISSLEGWRDTLREHAA